MRRLALAASLGALMIFGLWAFGARGWHGALGRSAAEAPDLLEGPTADRVQRDVVLFAPEAAPFGARESNRSEALPDAARGAGRDLTVHLTCLHAAVAREGDHTAGRGLDRQLATIRRDADGALDPQIAPGQADVCRACDPLRLESNLATDRHPLALQLLETPLVGVV